MDRLHENQIYTGTVESYSSEGLGIVRLDGAVVFVPGAVRGETIDLKITKVMKTAAAGETVKLHNPSPDRATPECPYYGQCGGCDFQHLTYPGELRGKRQRVQDTLARLGGNLYRPKPPLLLLPPPTKIFLFVGTPFYFICSAEVNSACAKVLGRCPKTLVRRTAPPRLAGPRRATRRCFPFTPRPA